MTILWGLLLMGCGDPTLDTAANIAQPEAEPASPTAEPAAPTAEPAEEIDPSSYASVEPLFLSYACTGCHGTSGNFTLSYSTLLNDSSSITGTPYVSPGNPEQSYLYIKLTNGMGISGQPMPLGGAGSMSDEDKELIAQWIMLGANP
jgi:hypothetical protein